MNKKNQPFGLAGRIKNIHRLSRTGSVWKVKARAPNRGLYLSPFSRGQFQVLGKSFTSRNERTVFVSNCQVQIGSSDFQAQYTRLRSHV